MRLVKHLIDSLPTVAYDNAAGYRTLTVTLRKPGWNDKTSFYDVPSRFRGGQMKAPWFTVHVTRRKGKLVELYIAG